MHILKREKRRGKKKSREKGLSALEGDLRKALGRSFLRWEKDNMKGTSDSVYSYLHNLLKKLKPALPAPFPIAEH
jgi:hypothetical protein